MGQSIQCSLVCAWLVNGVLDNVHRYAKYVLLLVHISILVNPSIAEQQWMKTQTLAQNGCGMSWKGWLHEIPNCTLGSGAWEAMLVLD